MIGPIIDILTEHSVIEVRERDSVLIAEWLTAQIPIGHVHFCNDVSTCLRVSSEVASRLVSEHGIVPDWLADGSITIADGPRYAAVSKKELSQILMARGYELALHTKPELDRSGIFSDAPVYVSSRCFGLREFIIDALDS